MGVLNDVLLLLRAMFVPKAHLAVENLDAHIELGSLRTAPNVRIKEVIVRQPPPHL